VIHIDRVVVKDLRRRLLWSSLDCVPHQDVVDFFDAAVRAFRQFPTYDILAVGFTPVLYRFKVTTIYLLSLVLASCRPTRLPTNSMTSKSR
jgi:hypothetical protein